MASSLKVKKNFDLKRRLRVIQKGDFRAFLIGGADVIVDNIIGNVKHQKDPTGKSLIKNKAKTLEIKARLGKGRFSLIWNRVLINPRTWKFKSSKKKIRIFLDEKRNRIGRRLHKLGYIFMGISDKARRIVFARWVKFIRRGLR